MITQQIDLDQELLDRTYTAYKQARKAINQALNTLKNSLLSIAIEGEEADDCVFLTEEEDEDPETRAIIEERFMTTYAKQLAGKEIRKLYEVIKKETERNKQTPLPLQRAITMLDYIFIAYTKNKLKEEAEQDQLELHNL